MGHGTVVVEACVESVAAAVAAQAAGAARVELCVNLRDDGTTPPPPTIAQCRERLAIALFVLIRPRAGSFQYDDTEFATMCGDIEQAKRLGADGIVVGGLDAHGAVDVARIERLIAAARPLPVTFHRAFDQTSDPFAALEQLIELGCDRVLTSGHADTAETGIPILARLVRQAAGQIGVLAAGKIDSTNVMRIIRETGVREIHLRGERLPGVMESLGLRK